MFIIPLGMLTGASTVTLQSFLLNNLVPVTLGNTFAGAVLVACSYNSLYGTHGQTAAATNAS